MLQPPIFCNNCGDRGHPFRDCKKPVLSCGIILLRNKSKPDSPAELPLENDDIEVLMIRRKDSMSYTEFIRGKYEPSDHAYVRRLFDNMTQGELQSLRNQPFEQLWAKLWNYTDRHEHELTIAKDKFDQVTGLLKGIKSKYADPEWGFPKGRRYRSEHDLACAEREFTEETNIERDAYVTVKDVVFSETFLGTNGIPYEHKYFLAILVKPFDIHQKFTIMQKREISAIGWKTLSDCMTLTRPHYSGREVMLTELSKFVGAVEVHIPTSNNGSLGT